MSARVNLQPVPGQGYRRVIVRREPDPESVRGIAIPVIKQRHSVAGVVVAVDDHPQSRHLRVGQRVLFGPYSGSDIEHRGETLTVMPVTEIVAELEPHAVVG